MAIEVKGRTACVEADNLFCFAFHVELTNSDRSPDSVSENNYRHVPVESIWIENHLTPLWFKGNGD